MVLVMQSVTHCPNLTHIFGEMAADEFPHPYDWDTDRSLPVVWNHDWRAPPLGTTVSIVTGTHSFSILVRFFDHADIPERLAKGESFTIDLALSPTGPIEVSLSTDA